MNRARRASSSGATPSAPLAGAGEQSAFGGRLVFGAAVSLALAFAACGPAGESVDASVCPPQPLYDFVYNSKTGMWSRVLVTAKDGGAPLTDADVTAITKAEENCLTPAGSATSLTSSGSPPETSSDASAD